MEPSVVPTTTLPADASAVLQPESVAPVNTLFTVTQSFAEFYAWSNLQEGQEISIDLRDTIEKTKVCGKCKKPKAAVFMLVGDKAVPIDAMIPGKSLNTQGFPSVASIQFCECGRPPKYDEYHTIKKADEYLKSCKDGYEKVPVKVREYKKKVKDPETEEEIEQVHEETDYVMKFKVNLPSIEGLANYLGVSRETVYDWDTKFPEFSDIIKQLKSQQATSLINNGLSANYSPVISKVLLAKHGYKDQNELDLRNPDGSLGGLSPEQRSKLDKLLINPDHAEQSGVAESNNGDQGGADLPV